MVTQIPEKLNELINVLIIYSVFNIELVLHELFAFYECFYAKIENILTYCFKLIVKQ